MAVQLFDDQHITNNTILRDLSTRSNAAPMFKNAMIDGLRKTKRCSKNSLRLKIWSASITQLFFVWWTSGALFICKFEGFIRATKAKLIILQSVNDWRSFGQQLWPKWNLGRVREKSKISIIYPDGGQANDWKCIPNQVQFAACLHVFS